jgi:hypothetical protein
VGCGEEVKIWKDERREKRMEVETHGIGELAYIYYTLVCPKFRCMR